MGVALWAALAFAGAPAQTAAAEAAQTSSSVSADPQGLRIPAETVLVIETLEPLSSSALKRGDKFAFRLAEPWPVEGAPALAAGTQGVGEVVHAQAAHGGGAPGELLLAARYLEIGGQRIPLRGYKLGATGKSNAGLALGASFATGPFALFIRGREIEIPAHTRGEARVAQDTALASVPIAPNSPASTDHATATVTSPEESP
ncbi:hypothetical protein FCE95_05660 [Luteimonas gilva]|uniref:Uncharacterized protein n=1 Tax=Luteimonas gilva TaxID=2572684 RepID=A0A4U5JX70_9GAMM|nr:hypothetical protein [Luteimonas gilva]TKR33766.1 hypothetical protein FCE95_05660 [Luteimonas gilva]